MNTYCGAENKKKKRGGEGLQMGALGNGRSSCKKLEISPKGVTKIRKIWNRTRRKEKGQRNLRKKEETHAPNKKKK